MSLASSGSKSKTRVVVTSLCFFASAALFTQGGWGFSSPSEEARQKASEVTTERIDAILKEALNKSSVIDYAFYLTDVHGPRLTGSPAFRKAAEWARKTLEAAGLSNVHYESATAEGWSEPGWSHGRYAVRLLEPEFATLLALPAPYSPPTPGRVMGEPIFFLLPGRSGVPIEEIMRRFRGRLRGKILMVSDEVLPVEPQPASRADRYSHEALMALREPEPPPRPAPAPPAPGQKRPERSREQVDNDWRTFFSFMRDEGAVAFLAPTRGEGGAMLAVGPLGRPGLQPPPPPGFNLPAESYNRIVRLMKRGIPVRIEVELESEFHDANGHTSVIAELPGTAKNNEVVLAGAHLDSWHAGTGATDNAANCAVLMESMRILKALRLPLARTVRMALWAGHERGVRGSLAYIKKMRRAPTEKLYMYFNMDGGAGRVIGLQIQQTMEWLPVADKWLAPFAANGQGYVSVRKTVGSDQYSFDQAGLPNMVFLQGPAFNPRTYHSNIDVFDYLMQNHLRESAAVVAAVLFQAANE